MGGVYENLRNSDPWPFSGLDNEDKKQTLTIHTADSSNPTFALFHVHPNGGGIFPSTPGSNAEGNAYGDTGVADKYGFQIYVVSKDGLTMYDPKTKETSKEPLRKGLDWTKPCPEEKPTK
jgi:hypothetical protein